MNVLLKLQHFDSKTFYNKNSSTFPLFMKLGSMKTNQQLLTII